MPEASRKKMSKSRYGCLVCKRKKIKCDEIKPVCGSCERLLIRCSYGNRAEVVPNSPPSSPQSRSPLKALVTTESLEQDPLQPMDCELLYHWTKYGAYTFSDDPKRTYVWAVSFPQLAFKHNFLLHTLLATSSLHLACTSKAPDCRRYLAACDKHFHWAITQYRAEICNLSSQNCEPLFACGMLLFLSSFSQQENDDGLPNERNLDQQLTLGQGIRFMREGRALFKPYLQQIMAGNLGPLLAEPDPSTFLVDDPGILTNFDTLCAGVDNSQALAYNQAIASLKTAYASRACGSPLKMVGGWPITLSETFVELLEGGDARALVVLAHYCAVSHASSRCWWVRQSQIEGQLKRIEEWIGEKWRAWLEWPKYVISLTTVGEGGLRH